MMGSSEMKSEFYHNSLSLFMEVHGSKNLTAVRFKLNMSHFRPIIKSILLKSSEPFLLVFLNIFAAFIDSKIC